MIELLGALIPLALVDSVSPVRLAALVTILGGERPISRGLAFLAALFASYYALGLLIALGVDRLFEFLFAEDPRPVDLALGGLIGVVLLLYGLYNLREPHMERQPRQMESVEEYSPVVLAIGINTVTGLAALPYFAAIDLILRAGVPTVGMLAALAIYCGVFLAPYLALLGARAVLGNDAERVLERVSAAVDGWMPRAMAVLFVLLGLTLVIDAAAYFLFDRSLL